VRLPSPHCPEYALLATRVVGRFVAYRLSGPIKPQHPPPPLGSSCPIFLLRFGALSSLRPASWPFAFDIGFVVLSVSIDTASIPPPPCVLQLLPVFYFQIIH
jgi:hypothetical protein